MKREFARLEEAVESSMGSFGYNVNQAALEVSRMLERRIAELEKKLEKMEKHGTGWRGTKEI